MKRSLHRCERAASCAVEDFQHDQIRPRSNASIHPVPRGDQTGDVSAMAVRVGDIASGEVLEVEDRIGDAIVVGVRAEEWVVRVDAAVDDHDGTAVLHGPHEIVVDEELEELRLAVPCTAHDMRVLKPCRERYGKR